jgi:transposase-like protein
MKTMKPKDGRKKIPRRKAVANPSVMNRWTEQDKLERITCLARDGYTDTEIAEKMGVSSKTLQTWRIKCPEIDAAVRNGKEVIDSKVESALLKAALGGMTTETKVILVYKKLELVKTIKERITREQPPNVLACQTWLFNRQRDKWKRNRDNELTVEDDRSINITITRAGQAIEVEA